MSSFSETELRVVAVLLSLVAVYIHYPAKGIPKWLYGSKDTGFKTGGTGDGAGKDFVVELQESVRSPTSRSRDANLLTRCLVGEESNSVLRISDGHSVS